MKHELSLQFGSWKSHFMGTEHENRCCMQEVNRWVAFPVDSVHIWFPKARRFWISRAWRFFAATRPWKAGSWASWPMSIHRTSHMTPGEARILSLAQTPTSARGVILQMLDPTPADDFAEPIVPSSFWDFRFHRPGAGAAPAPGHLFAADADFRCQLLASRRHQHIIKQLQCLGNHHSWHVVFTFLCCSPVQTLYQSARFLARKRCLALILLILLRKRVTGETDLASHHIPPLFFWHIQIHGFNSSMDHSERAIVSQCISAYLSVWLRKWPYRK